MMDVKTGADASHQMVPTEKMFLLRFGMLSFANRVLLYPNNRGRLTVCPDRATGYLHCQMMIQEN